MSEPQRDVQPLSAEDVEALDPGVRDLVVALREAGYGTTDSGDGVTKPQVDGCTLPFLHVYVRVADHWLPELVEYANCLDEWLLANGHGHLTVEASYVPGEPAFCMVRKKLTWNDIDVAPDAQKAGA
jgi:hypothetical protein